MNRYQKEYQQKILDNEKEVLEALKKNYEDALDNINEELQYLMSRNDTDMQYVIYQKEYQKSLKNQVESILNDLNSEEFESVSDYLERTYEDGFIGTMYDIQSQGIPLIFPIDQEQVVKAITHDTKLSTDLYSAFNIKELKKNIASEISIGISNAVTYNEIARRISKHCSVNLNNAMRIARTEGHRINIQAAMDAQHKAKEKGADIVKQWDATLDSKTRQTHRELDGQIRELDEDFEYSGGSVSAPAHFGNPAEDCNCRCALLQRARWALGNDITKYSPDAVEEITDDGVTKLFKIKADDYEDFKNEYFKNVDNAKSNAQKISSPINTRNTSRGKSSAISQFDVSLNSRQANLLEKLPEYDSAVIIDKSDVKMSDLSSLTAKTGCEFAMFTNGSKRMIIRGNESSVNVTVDKAKEMAENGYRWSGHTHPGYDYNCLIASGGDYEVLKAFGQKQSVTYNSIGQYLTYELE